MQQEPQIIGSKRKIRIVAISDTHNIYSELDKFQFPPADIFIHAGDISCSSGPENFQNFRRFLQKLPYKHKIVIGGNHDFGIEASRQKYLSICQEFSLDEELRIDNVTERQKLKEYCIYLEHEYIEIEGLKIFASPYIESTYTQGFQLKHGDAIKAWSKIPEGLDILITHMPPYGILDKIKTGQSVGSKRLRNAVDITNPKIHIFGHIHQSHGYRKVGNTHFYNVSHMNQQYIADHDPTVIEFQI